MERRKLTAQQIKKFQGVVWEYYDQHGRDLPWRRTKNPYHILVSEIMLQQTQVERVKTYYVKFLQAFPDWHALAEAPLQQLLALWQGLGYNRRALFLQRAAQKIVQKYHGNIPKTIEELSQLPGIGKATAGAILAYSYNLPVAFIETNIRRVFLYHFFLRPSKLYAKMGPVKLISDKEILPLVEQALPQDKIREWYWALMDYGSALPKTVANPNRASKHYVKQSKFEGSRRQLRANIVKLLLEQPRTLKAIAAATKKPEPLLAEILLQLTAEGFLKKQNNLYQIP